MSVNDYRFLGTGSRLTVTPALENMAWTALSATDRFEAVLGVMAWDHVTMESECSGVVL